MRVLFLFLTLAAPAFAAEYAWRGRPAAAADTLQARIQPPPGFSRLPAAPGSWEEWLRGLPLKPAGSPVLLYNGAKKTRQDVHQAVVDIDAGRRDLQQCADAVMRLWAEYQWSRKNYAAISFGDGNGKPLRYVPGASPAHAAFRSYMDKVFARSGSYSLSKELVPARLADLSAGDVFIKGGFPGHAVLVVDVARDRGGRKVFLLAQSYMPAQEIHVLKNFEQPDLSPWYALEESAVLRTPEWDFAAGSLKRFPAR